MNLFDTLCNKILEEAHSSSEFDKLLKKVRKSSKVKEVKPKKSGFMVIPADKEMSAVTLHKDPIHGVRKLKSLITKLGIDDEENEKKEKK